MGPTFTRLAETDGALVEVGQENMRDPVEAYLTLNSDSVSVSFPGDGVGDGDDLKSSGMSSVLLLKQEKNLKNLLLFRVLPIIAGCAFLTHGMYEQDVCHGITQAISLIGGCQEAIRW